MISTMYIMNLIGMKDGNNGVWDATEYLQNLSLLDNHIGIPMAEQLHCPMFTQNKIEYIQALGDVIIIIAITIIITIVTSIMLYIHTLGEDAIPTLFVALSNFHHHERGYLSTDLLYSNKSGIFCWKKSSRAARFLCNSSINLARNSSARL